MLRLELHILQVSGDTAFRDGVGVEIGHFDFDSQHIHNTQMNGKCKRVMMIVHILRVC